jgi:hypothetical protein
MITVTTATLFDVSNILAYGREAFGRSNYSPMTYNSVIARRTLKAAMNDPAMRVFVAKKDGTVCGLLIGMIDPMPFCVGFSATDLLFTATAGGDLLLDKFIAWCKARRVARIDMGVSQEGNDEVVTRFYESRGFVRSGGVFYQQDESIAKPQEVRHVSH